MLSSCLFVLNILEDEAVRAPLSPSLLLHFYFLPIQSGVHGKQELVIISGVDNAIVYHIHGLDRVHV